MSALLAAKLEIGTGATVLLPLERYAVLAVAGPRLHDPRPAAASGTGGLGDSLAALLSKIEHMFSDSHTQ